jgi:hypothetical protein
MNVKLLQGSTVQNLKSAGEVFQAIRQEGKDRDRDDRVVVFVHELPELVRRLAKFFPCHPFEDV